MKHLLSLHVIFIHIFHQAKLRGALKPFNPIVAGTKYPELSFNFLF